MPFEKLNAFTKKVQDLADKPNATMTAAEVKAQFDAAPDEVRVYLNKLIDVLQSTIEGDSGADNVAVTEITGLTGASVQSILEALKVLEDENKTYLLSQIQGITLGQIPDGTITDVKLSEAPTNIKAKFNKHLADIGKLENLETDNKITIVNAINEVFQSGNSRKEELVDTLLSLDDSLPISYESTWEDILTHASGVNTGMTYAYGIVNAGPAELNPLITIRGLDFEPKTVFVWFDDVPNSSNSYFFGASFNTNYPERIFSIPMNGAGNPLIADLYSVIANGQGTSGAYNAPHANNKFYDDGFSFYVRNGVTYWYGKKFKWVALG